MEQVSRQIDKYGHGIELLKKQALGLGTAKDGPALRNKLASLRQDIAKRQQDLMNSIEGLQNQSGLSGQDSETLGALNKKFAGACREYGTVDAEVQKKERDHRNLVEGGVARGPGAVSGSFSLTAGSGGALRQDQCVIRRVDHSELATEEVLQRAKLEEAHEIEALAREVHAATSEFGQLVNEQQEGITRIQQNVSKTETHLTKGTEQLKKARGSQW